jgi:hypothetical protein
MVLRKGLGISLICNKRLILIAKRKLRLKIPPESIYTNSHGSDRPTFVLMVARRASVHSLGTS